jgi:hypothetical protein
LWKLERRKTKPKDQHWSENWLSSDFRWLGERKQLLVIRSALSGSGKQNQIGCEISECVCARSLASSSNIPSVDKL